MGQVSRERSIAIQVEGWDAIPVAIYSNEDPLRRGIKNKKIKKIKKEKQRVKGRGIKNYINEKHVIQRTIVPQLAKGRT